MTAQSTAEPATDVSLREALEAADLRVLLACLYQATGDEQWLRSPYVPKRDVALVPDPGAGFDEPTAHAIRDAAAGLFETSGDVAIPRPDETLLVRMMSHLLGEQVAPEYGPLVAVDLGFAPHSSDGAEPIAGTDVIIVGTGVCGISLGKRLLDAGCDVSVIERRAEVGGTWHENRYPAAGVDTPNHFYSYSFAPNPRWSRYFSKREEIHGYLQDVFDTSGLRERTTFGYDVTNARWLADEGRWEVIARSADGDLIIRTCRVLVSAIGHFGEPITPRLEGIESFTGEVIHSARWPESTDLRGKRVAVVGTGASAMQFVPAIADEVESMVVYQRTPQWVRPVDSYNKEVDPRAQRLFTDIPNYAKWYRFSQFWRYGDGLLQFLKRDPEWEHPARSLNRTNDRHRAEMTAFLESELDGRPDLIEKSLPDYPPFGKRILIDNDWFKTIRRPNVELVTDSIERIEPTGVRTADGELREADVLIMATGFNVTSLAARIDVRGADDKSLREDWKDENPTAHLGITVPGFPNFFVMYGPNTNAGHGGSMMWLAETQSDYVTSMVRWIDRDDLHSIEPTEEARTRHTELIDDMHEDLVWMHPGVSTYYRTSAGVVRSPMPFRLVDYWHMTQAINPDDYVTT